jgi:hypothetical protein
MPLPKLRPKDLPGWPRRLSVELAAAYVGVSPSHFEREVDQGVWPRPTRSGMRKLWDRLSLDRTMDQDEELMFNTPEVTDDPVMEALHAKTKRQRA